MKNQVGRVEERGETVAEAAGATCDQHNSNKSGGTIGTMATGGCLPSAELQTAHSNARINVCDFNLLHNYFLHMFESSEDTNAVKDKHKKNKKSKAKCPKSREKRPIEPLSSLYYSVPEIKISRNASWFAMFASVRRTCLEHQSRAATLLQVAAAAAWQEGGECAEVEVQDTSDNSKSNLPRVVGLGLRAVFDMIRETEASHPSVCKRGLQSLLDVLQGLQPEELRDEPEAVLETMFTTLLELASRPGAPVAINGNAEPGQHIRALACSCLLALAVAGGSTGHLLRSTAALLMSPRYTACELVLLPAILASLQRSVHSILIRRTVHPDFMSHGVPVSCLVDTFPVAWAEGASREVSRCYSLASDGHHLYLHTSAGLYKVGSGFSGTMRGHVYRHRPDFFPLQPGWLGFAGSCLYYKNSEEKRFELVVVDRESLEQVRVVSSMERFPTPHLLLTDGEQVGLVTAARDGDAFTIKFLSSSSNSGPLVSAGELPIKLARKCVELVGSSIVDEGQGPASLERAQVDFGVDDEVGSLGTGKEFSLMLTTSGKLYYSGKSSAISQKQPCPPGRWNEVVVSRSGSAPTSISQFSVGLDGLHALLVGEEGSVYFTGTSKRGEDADRTDRPRRQPKPSKPKKMSRMEGHTVVTTACNSGTSCIVTKKGELYVFGKDSSHADFNTGLVTDLSGHTIISVAAGKAHIVALSSNHEVFTFGMNNKGQCGREFPPGGNQGNPIMAADGEEGSDHEGEVDINAAVPDTLCPPGKHKWKHDQCMVCAICGECTGYGSGCVSASRPDRNPGMFCGCGSGDSGCSECGSCRGCAGEAGSETEGGGAAGEGAGPGPVRDLIRLDLLAGQGESRGPREHRDKFIKRRLAKMGKESRRSRKYAEPMGGNSRERRGSLRELQREEGEKEASGKLTSLGPGRVHLPGDCRVSAVACGLHHTLLLSTSGQVFAFGSNSHGQLGVGDLAPRGAPAPVHRIGEKVVRVATGSYHSVALTVTGRVFTWGNNAKGQLGRVGPSGPNLAPVEVELWYALPGPIQGLGNAQGKSVTWIGASADQTIMKLDESLINAQNLVGATICSNKHQVLLLPTHNQQPTSFHSLCIARSDGFCRSFSSLDQVEWAGRVAALDPLYNVLWSLCGETGTVQCYNPTAADIEQAYKVQENDGKQSILSPDLAIPVTSGCLVSRSQAALNLLSCLDTITGSPSATLTRSEEESRGSGSLKALSKEDFSIVNRFESHGGGWGYSGHSIEAVRFCIDTDIIIGGFGLFGGRGEYVGKIKLFDIGTEGGEQESDGELMAESEEVTYECGARQKFPVLFEEPVPLVAGKWYVAWARVSGPSSDCGSSGQAQVTTEDQIQFTFKSSKKSNNGTDVNAGQIPQLLYRSVVPDSTVTGRRYEPPDPVHILSTKFGRPLTTESFQALLALLQWAWSTFKVSVAEVVDAPANQAALMDLNRLVFVSRASLRLLVSYIEDIYPSPASNREKESGPSVKPVAETQRLAECVFEVRSQLVSMLSDPLPVLASVRCQPANLRRHQALEMADSLLQDAHLTYVSCFQAFYPTGPLKWVCLCSLLSSLESQTCHRLLAAVIDSLCNPQIKLRSTFPIGACDTEKQGKGSTTSPVENVSVTGSMVQLGEMAGGSTRYPILAEVMNYHSQAEAVKYGSWIFSDVLNRLLTIVTLPISEALQGEKVSYSKELMNKTCRLIACVVSELSNMKGGGDTGLASIANKVSLITPNRFTRTSNSRTWNTGNGSPDAICFSVDKGGILISGASVYGGVGTFDYELELLHDQSTGEKDSNQSQRWISMEMCHGTYSSDDCTNDIAMIKFDKPVAVLPHTKYALRLRNQGARTNNGDGGNGVITGSDGTKFTFSSCSLSFNGTNPTRGQLPQILYHSSPNSDEPNITASTASLANTFSRQSALSITVSVVRSVGHLLAQARDLSKGRGHEVLNSAPVITTLLPHIMASVAGMASTEPAAAVQVLSLVQDLLPSVATLNNKMIRPSSGLHSPGKGPDPELPSPHYAWVESDHPYKPAGLANYRVVFPPAVRWMSVEFDPLCCTSQQEDTLQLFIRNPAAQRPRNLAGPLVTSQNADLVKSQKYSSVLNKFSGKKGWPSHGVVLPGNEVLFSLETASDYVKGDNKESNYGFRCLVTGYECQDGGGDGLKNIEHELAYLGGVCAASLMSKSIQLPVVQGEEGAEEGTPVEEAAQELYDKYPTLLRKGFAIEHLPNIHQALAGYIPFSCQSYERLFLKDLVQCSPNTAGGRLAAWLQPESYVSVENCGVTFRPEDMRCSWPAIVTVVTRDQYGATAHVPNMKVEVKAVPIDEMNSSLAGSANSAKMKKLTQPDSMTFGGHPPPNLENKYEVTVKDKMFYHAITVSKSYDDYSFEELRYASPKLQRQSENMLVRPNGDGTYSANWTPGNIGWYRLLVSLDGCELPGSHRVEVLDPPQGKIPPTQNNKKSCPQGEVNRLRQFVARPSAGLRIRLHPTLQSEQIGVVPVDGTLSIIDELSNSDGVWVRVSAESLLEYCGPTFTEGWALQYNQHFDKVLLRQIVEPLPTKTKETSNFIKPPSNPTPTLFVQQDREKKRSSGARRGPGIYTVVKCGASGHNLRCAPSMQAAPVGMLSLGDNVTVAEVKEVGAGEVWVRLDKDHAEKFSLGAADGEVWSLAVTATDTHYLESEAEIQEQRWPELPIPPSSGFDPVASSPLFPFGTSEASGGANVWTQGPGPPATNFATPFSPADSSMSTLSPRDPNSFPLSRRKSLPRPLRPSTPPRQVMAVGGAIGKVPSSPTPGRGRAGSIERKSFFQKWFKPGDELARRPSGAGSPPQPGSRKASPADLQRKPVASFNKDIPPELQGVSVKELVKVIGASRANGNGVTPPGTPGTPRKSRSASPAAGPVQGALAFSRSRSSSPISIGHGRGVPRSPGPSQLSTSVASLGSLEGGGGLARQNSAGSQSDTSALVSSLTRDMSGMSASPSRDLSCSLRTHDGSISPVSLRSDHVRSESPVSRHSSPKRQEGKDIVQALQMSTASLASMEISQESLFTKPEIANPLPASPMSKPAVPERPQAAASVRPRTAPSPSVPHHEYTGPVVEAMSPSVAESIRSVFAAFIWHAGVVQDAMACASFLKFNSELTKQGSGITHSINMATEKASRETKAKQRHSVEVISTAYLNYKENDMMDKSAANANTNRNIRQEATTPGLRETAIPEEREGVVDEVVPGLPPTLGQLVVLWEGVVLSCLDNIVEQSSLNSWSKQSRNSLRRHSNNAEKNSQQKFDQMWAVGKNKEQADKVAMGNDANLGGQGSYCQVCDICGGYFEHPVTYHMRISHPGCGSQAGGKGYNSGGQYCGGWAGNCGDGGVGGSSWYLICEACKEKHSKEHGNKAGKARPFVDLGTGKKNSERARGVQAMPITSMMASLSRATASSPVGPMDCHILMKSNSMFLLDLASSTSEESSRNDGLSGLATVAELTPGDPGSFPYTQFHCLEALGVQDSQLKELNDELILEESWRKGASDSNWDGAGAGESRSSSETLKSELLLVDLDADKADANPEGGEIDPPEEFQGAPQAAGAGAVVRRNRFHRSVSIGSPRGKEWSPSPSGNRTVLTNRKRNSSYEDSGERGSTAEFLAHTSPAWKRLFEGPGIATKLLDSPVMAFLLQWNDLDSLQVAMQLSLRKAVCRAYAMQAFTWLLRSVSQPVCLHDLLWSLISSLQQPAASVVKESNKNTKKDKDEANAAVKDEEDVAAVNKEREEGFEHPMSDLSLVGGAVQSLPSTFHTLLQTISDLMLLLPLGSALQQAAISCFALRFWPSDHPFLHQSHLFSTISKILSRGEGEVDDVSPRLGQVEGGVEAWVDLTPQVEVTVSSRQAMVPSLTDSSTETFWESGDEDRNKTKWVAVKLPGQSQARSLAVHIDNGRDIGNKVGSLTFKTGRTVEDMVVVKSLEVDSRFAGWVTCFLSDTNCEAVRIEVKGPDNTVRLRQVKVVGKGSEASSPNPPEKMESQRIQQSNCEVETLRVFRLITSQVFGKLLEPESELVEAITENWEGHSGTDLKEHVVGILFSRSKLSHLQKQVCSHIVAAISKETACLRDDWELSLCSEHGSLDQEDVPKLSDSYCFEMLSMVLALSGSKVGSLYLAQQYSLLRDLLSLLHTGTARVQRAVIAVLRRVLPLVAPARFANILSVATLPPKDFTILTAASLQSKGEDLGRDPAFDPHNLGILDVFLGCISKALTIQVKKKVGAAGRAMSTVSLASCIHPRAMVGSRWWLRGSLSKKISEEIVQMLRDMSQGGFGEDWAYIAKSAIAEAVLNLTRLGPDLRAPEEGVRCGTVWLAVAALCVLDREHVEGLSSGDWGGGGGGAPDRPTCSNHDDGETQAIILCDSCGNLCADCDRFLHLHRRTRHHSRQVFKEEEEAIKVNLHEGCGRTKLFWLTAVADAATLKGMIEFREETGRKRSSTSTAVCRYCGGSSCAALPVMDGVCTQEECTQHQAASCGKTNPCGHPCGGIANESPCLPCLHGCDKTAKLKQDADDMCMICFTEALYPIPSILLACGHVFHLHCCRAVLTARWSGPRISFGFTNCPICKVRMVHPALNYLLDPVQALHEDVRKKALMRLEYEGLSKCEAVSTKGARWYNDPAGFAMERYAYYVCYKCGKAYFGGEARCDLDAGIGDAFNPEELVCGGCSDVSQAQMCPKHGTDYLEYKCRYCCSVAVFFCFGTTHFCNSCHDDFQRVANIPKAELPQCPVGPKAVALDQEECPLHVKHPATGEEFALGCGVCRNAHTF